MLIFDVVRNTLYHGASGANHSPPGDHTAPDWPSDQIQTSIFHVNFDPFGLIIHMPLMSHMSSWLNGLMH